MIFRKVIWVQYVICSIDKSGQYIYSQHRLFDMAHMGIIQMILLLPRTTHRPAAYLF